MNYYQDFQKLCRDTEIPEVRFLGLETGEDISYFCTPKGARIIGWAGVDGIHYCFVRGFGEMVFAVSPMNLPGEYVHPIAKDFAGLLGMLMACGSLDALEQAWGWDRAQFDAYLQENPASEEQQALFALLQEKLGIEPVADPYGYLKALQQSFDYSRIPWSEDYEDPDMNSGAADDSEPEEPVSFWRVTWEESSGRNGREIPVNRTFSWGEERWYLPSIYRCGKGLVVDFCVEVEPDSVAAFLSYYQGADERTLSHMEIRTIQQQNPLHVEFRPVLWLNGKKLSASSGCGMIWLAESCLPEGERQDRDSLAWIRHYQLDPTRCWSFHRWRFPWITKKPPVLRSLGLRLEREPFESLGTPFVTPAVGQPVSLCHPVTGQAYTLTAAEVEERQLEEGIFSDPGMEYPRCLTAMTYTLEPDLTSDAFRIQDRENGDPPRRKEPPVPGAPEAVSAACFGIIGGADGPIAVMVGQPAPTVHGACSSLRFEPAEVTWLPIFRDKLLPDLELTIL